MPYYKGLYRKFWVKNQLLLNATRIVIENLSAAGIEVLFHKGAGIILSCDLKPALRPMDDIDFIVHKEKVQQAIAILHELGWRPTFDNPEDLDLIHAYAFNNGKGQNIDLHWHSLDTDLTELHTPGYWERSFASELVGIPVRVMSPTDQLIHACVHGIRWSRIPPIRWIVDSAMLIDDSTGRIDWDHLIQHTKNLSASIPVFQGLSYLQSEFNIQIPASVLEALERIPVTRTQKWDFWLAQKKRHPVFGLLTYNKKIVDYLRFHRKNFPFPGYLRYLQRMWRVDHLWQVPFVGIAHIWQNVLGQTSNNHQKDH
jgi:hypothetical protein